MDSTTLENGVTCLARRLEEAVQERIRTYRQILLGTGVRAGARVTRVRSVSAGPTVLGRRLSGRAMGDRVGVAAGIPVNSASDRFWKFNSDLRGLDAYRSDALVQVDPEWAALARNRQQRKPQTSNQAQVALVPNVAPQGHRTPFNASSCVSRVRHSSGRFARQPQPFPPCSGLPSRKDHDRGQREFPLLPR